MHGKRPIVVIGVALSIAAATLVSAPATSPADSPTEESTSLVSAAVYTSLSQSAGQAKFVLSRGDGYVIVDPGKKVVAANGATFYPTGALDSETLIVIPNDDGTLPGGLKESELKTLVAEARSRSHVMANVARVTLTSVTPEMSPASMSSAMASFTYAASSTGWSTQYYGSSKIGASSTTKMRYWFNANSGGAQNSGSGWGHYTGYNGGVFGLWSVYYNLGTTPAGGEKMFDVPWGNVMDITRFRARCATTTVCGGYWGP